MNRIAPDDPGYYFNRHMQWLEFSRRVLEEDRPRRAAPRALGVCYREQTAGKRPATITA